MGYFKCNTTNFLIKGIQYDAALAPLLTKP